MSGSEPRVVRAMVRALREEATPELDWDGLEARLMARIDAADASESVERIETNTVETRGDLAGAGLVPARTEPSARPRSPRRALGWLPLVAASLLVAAGVWAAARNGDEPVPDQPSKSSEAVEPSRPQPPASRGRAFERTVEAPASDAPLPIPESTRPSAPLGGPTSRVAKPFPSTASEVAEPATPPTVSFDTSRTVVTEAELRGRIEGCFSTVALPEAGREGVAVDVGSTLRIQVAEDGAVVQAQFDPPLKPELQRCALFVLASRLGPGARTVAIPVRAR